MSDDEVTMEFYVTCLFCHTSTKMNPDDLATWAVVTAEMRRGDGFKRVHAQICPACYAEPFRPGADRVTAERRRIIALAREYGTESTLALAEHLQQEGD